MKIIKNIFLFIVIFLVFNMLLKKIINYQKKFQFYLQIKNQYERLKKKNIELKTQLVRKNDPIEIEKKAREKLNLGKEQEIIIILPPPSPTPIIITPSPKPIWHQWLDLYLNQDKIGR